MKKLLLLIVLITFSGCRVAKKEWVKENFAESSSLTQLLQELNQSTEKKFQEVSETFTSKFKEISESKSSSSSESESEDTSVTGTITAEDGKEKSVTIGGTTITSNGANLTFTTNTTKAISKELTESFQQISKELETERQYREQMQNEIDALKIKVFDLNSNYESEKHTSSKEVTKRGFSFGVWIILLIVVVVIIVSWRLKLFGKISKLFKIPIQNT